VAGAAAGDAGAGCAPGPPLASPPAAEDGAALLSPAPAALAAGMAGFGITTETGSAPFARPASVAPGNGLPSPEAGEGGGAGGGPLTSAAGVSPGPFGFASMAGRGLIRPFHIDGFHSLAAPGTPAGPALLSLAPATASAR